MFFTFPPGYLEPGLVRTAAENILGCYRQRYPGTFILSASKNIPVYWGHWSIVQAELNCLKDLEVDSLSWKYALNLAGSELMVISNSKLGKAYDLGHRL